MPSTLRRLLRILLGATLSITTVGAVSAIGVTVTMRQSFAALPQEPPPQGWPAARSAPPGRTVVAVVLGSTGSVVSDALAPYEVFARSESFRRSPAHRRPSARRSARWRVQLRPGATRPRRPHR